MNILWTSWPKPADSLRTKKLNFPQRYLEARTLIFSLALTLTAASGLAGAGPPATSTSGIETQPVPISGEGASRGTPSHDPRELLAEAAILEMRHVSAPSSLQIYWPEKWLQNADFKWNIWDKPIHGDLSCGTLNSRDRVGGYIGRSYFVVIVSDNRVVFLRMDSGQDIGLTAAHCKKLGF